MCTDYAGPGQWNKADGGDKDADSAVRGSLEEGSRRHSTINILCTDHTGEGLEPQATTHTMIYPERLISEASGHLPDYDIYRESDILAPF